MKPRLISFKLCPFVQRVAIALLYKAIDYDIDYVELADPPEWFLKLSPLKVVPLLVVKDRVLFDSTAINEYIEDVYPAKLHPADLILRAQDRSWIEFSSGCTWSAFHLSVKETEEDYQKVLEDLWSNFDRIEATIRATPYFNGNQLSLVDVSYAPLLQRLEFLDELRPGIWNNKRHPRIHNWKEGLLALDAVRRSTVPEIKEFYYELLWKRQGFISQFLDRAKYHKPVAKSVY